MKTVFVTGGSGFIGRNLIRGLLEQGYAVHALARSDSSAGRIEALGARSVRGDVLDRQAMTDGMRGCWGLIHARFVWGRDDTSALPEIVKAVEDGRLKWIGSGRYLTSTAHVANVVGGAIAALERGAAGQVYFITDGAPVPFRTFLTDMLATQGVAPPSADLPRWPVRAVVGLGSRLERVTGGRIRPPMSRQEYATIAHEVTVSDARARRELGYQPVITLDQGMAELRPGGAWHVRP